VTENKIPTKYLD